MTPKLTAFAAPLESGTGSAVALGARQPLAAALRN